MSFCCVGTLPADLARLPSLAFLDLSHNQLTGSLDDFGAALTGSNNLLQVCCTKHAQLSAVLCGCCFVLTVQNNPIVGTSGVVWYAAALV
jgi:hypothetical protein